jgi:hypothetical protein
MEIFGLGLPELIIIVLILLLLFWQTARTGSIYCGFTREGKRLRR